MTVNPELVGQTLPPTEPYLVGREKVRELARAVFATNPVHFDVAAAQAAGFADVVATPTFPIVLQDITLQQLIALPGSGIELKHAIHVEQRFSYARPIVAGDLLTAQLTVTGVRAMGPASRVVSTMSVRDESGTEVATAESTLLIGGGDE